MGFKVYSPTVRSGDKQSYMLNNDVINIYIKDTELIIRN